MAGGRPTKYKEEYCQQLLEHLKEGYSYKTFAALVNVNTDTLYEWERKNKKFSEAKKEGVLHSLLFWEKKGITGMTTPGFNATVWIFNMKNRHGWRDKSSEEVKEEHQYSKATDERINELLNKAK
jgi:transposase